VIRVFPSPDDAERLKWRRWAPPLTDRELYAAPSAILKVELLREGLHRRCVGFTSAQSETNCTENP
jgi:hypothetical protein